eukprot:1009280-Rhodomonas_salina.3
MTGADKAHGMYFTSLRQASLHTTSMSLFPAGSGVTGAVTRYGCTRKHRSLVELPTRSMCLVQSLSTPQHALPGQRFHRDWSVFYLGWCDFREKGKIKVELPLELDNSDPFVL